MGRLRWSDYELRGASPLPEPDGTVIERLALVGTVSVALVIAGGVVPLPAQPVRVELEVTESTGGLFEERFAAALAGLEGVERAGPSELAHYVLTVTVLCVPDPGLCETAESFGVSVVLSEPVTGAQLRNGLERTGDPILERWEPTPEASAFLQRYRRMHAVWATSWSRERYEQDVGRLVTGIDARCFQQRWILESRRSSLLQRGDTAGARRLPAEVDSSGRSLC